MTRYQLYPHGAEIVERLRYAGYKEEEHDEVSLAGNGDRRHFFRDTVSRICFYHGLL